MLEMLRARKEALEERGEQGFTLAELLIVVAIIAVLIAIAIPVFTKRLEQSRETTDLANLRSAYAAGQVAAMTGIGSTKPGELSDGQWEFDPNAEYGIVSGATGASIGQGTAVDGEIDVSNVPTQIRDYWHGDSDVRGKHIALLFDGSGLSAVGFH